MHTHVFLTCNNGLHGICIKKVEIRNSLIKYKHQRLHKPLKRKCLKFKKKIEGTRHVTVLTLPCSFYLLFHSFFSDWYFNINDFDEKSWGGYYFSDTTSTRHSDRKKNVDVFLFAGDIENTSPTTLMIRCSIENLQSGSDVLLKLNRYKIRSQYFNNKTEYIIFYRIAIMECG